jgi:hypothetical protein
MGLPGEVGLQVAAAMPRQGRCAGFRMIRFAKLANKFLFLLLPELATVTPVGVTTLLEASSWSFSIYLLMHIKCIHELCSLLC